jgi:hypothetical protein
MVINIPDNSITGICRLHHSFVRDIIGHGTTVSFGWSPCDGGGHFCAITQKCFKYPGTIQPQVGINRGTLSPRPLTQRWPRPIRASGKAEKMSLFVQTTEDSEC